MKSVTFQKMSTSIKRISLEKQVNQFLNERPSQKEVEKFIIDFNVKDHKFVVENADLFTFDLYESLIDLDLKPETSANLIRYFSYLGLFIITFNSTL